LKRTGANLLAGRALLKFMHPFLASELGNDFSLQKALEIGMLPLVWGSSNAKESLKTYAALYLKEEVQEEGLVRNLGDFARFLEIISFSHGCILNTTNIARECDIARKTVENYLGVLEDLLLSFTLPVFTKRAKRVLSSHPKFYFFDSGVFRSIRPQGPLDNTNELEGVALEGLVGQHLRAWISFQKDDHQLAFWRTKAGNEVDFIVYGPRVFLAIEVKHAKKIHPKDTNALEAFKEDYPECTPLLLYMGDKKLTQKNILCLPCEEFLKTLSPDSLIYPID
jgi:predicted AAA+ superfamily ATPase